MTFDGTSEIDRNYEAFIQTLPDILSEHAGQYALIHRTKIIDFFNTAAEAFTAGHWRFGVQAYSVQQVSNEVDDLGFYSYAGGTGQA